MPLLIGLQLGSCNELRILVMEQNSIFHLKKRICLYTIKAVLGTIRRKMN